MTYFITGGTGLIGKLLTEYIINNHKDNKCILLVRDMENAKKIYKEYTDNFATRLFFVEDTLEDILENKPLHNKTIDYIIHCAAPTQSSYMISHPVETADAIVLGTRNMLEFARKHHIKSMIYLSSMEVYGTVSDNGVPCKEQELGEIDLTAVRSCYSLGKRMAEHYCHIYQKEYYVPVKVARLAQTFGRGVRQTDNRVYMQFAKAVLKGENIVLKTDGMSMGNYCETDDVCDAIFTILERGTNGEVYNVVNEENTMTIYEMAELVANQIAGGKIKVEVKQEDIQITGYAPKTGLRMSSEKLRKLGWKPKKGIAEMYREVIMEILKFEI